MSSEISIKYQNTIFLMFLMLCCLCNTSIKCTKFGNLREDSFHSSIKSKNTILHNEVQISLEDSIRYNGKKKDEYAHLNQFDSKWKNPSEISNPISDKIKYLHKLNEISLLQTNKFYAENIECNETTCNSKEGNFCVNSNVCKCALGLANVLTPNSEFTYCSYKQKSLPIAILLHLIPGIGLSHLYAERFLVGFLQFIIGLYPVCYFLSTYLKSKSKGYNDNQEKPYDQYKILALILANLYFIWWTIDLVRFTKNIYNDGNDVPLIWLSHK